MLANKDCIKLDLMIKQYHQEDKNVMDRIKFVPGEKGEFSVTPAAAEKLKEIILQQGKKGYGIRVLVAEPGPFEMVYSMDFEKKAFSGDKTIEVDGLKVFYDGKAAPYLKGITLDFVTSPDEGFVFRKNQSHSHGEQGHGREGGCCGSGGGSGSGGGCGCGH